MTDPRLLMSKEEFKQNLKEKKAKIKMLKKRIQFRNTLAKRIKQIFSKKSGKTKIIARKKVKIVQGNIPIKSMRRRVFDPTTDQTKNTFFKKKANENKSFDRGMI